MQLQSLENKFYSTTRTHTAKVFNILTLKNFALETSHLWIRKTGMPTTQHKLPTRKKKHRYHGMLRHSQLVYEQKELPISSGILCDWW